MWSYLAVVVVSVLVGYSAGVSMVLARVPWSLLGVRPGPPKPAPAPQPQFRPRPKPRRRGDTTPDMYRIPPDANHSTVPYSRYH